MWLAATYTASYSTPTLSNNLVTSIYGLRDLDPVRNLSQNTSTHNIFILQHFLFGYDGIHLPADTLPLRAYYIILSISSTYCSYILLTPQEKLWHKTEINRDGLKIITITLNEWG